MALAEEAKLWVRLGLKDGLTSGLNKAGKGLGRFDSNVGRVGKGVGQMGLGFARAGVIIGAAGVAAGVAAAKVAIDYEDAFAGVRKTVEGTDDELNALSLTIRKMATEIPVSAIELAGIAEIGGQMGIAIGDMEAFTRTVAILGATTNVSIDEAAASLGQLGNIIGLQSSEYDNFAGALVALGNAGESTEAAILEVARRSGSTGVAIGLAKEQTLGWAAAAANLGMQQELAGTSLQKFYDVMQTTVSGGGDGLRLLAKTAGMTGKEFREVFEKDTQGALVAFLAGLEKLPKEQRLSVIREVFGKQSGLRRLMLGLASSLDDNVIPSLGLLDTEWEKGTAHEEEFAKRLTTVRSAITLLKNQATEAAIIFGEGIAPAIGRAASKLKEFIAAPENAAALKRLGIDIGKSIDSINWDSVLGFARTLVSAFQPALEMVKVIAGLVASLPPGLLGGVAGIVVTNKLSGGLIGEGAKNILGGLLGSVGKNFAASLTGGAVGAIPVRVVNWGGMPGGGGNVLPGAGGAAGAIASIGGAGAAASVMASLVPFAAMLAIPYIFKGKNGTGNVQASVPGGGTLGWQQLGMMGFSAPALQQAMINANNLTVIPAIQRDSDRQAFISRFGNTQLTRNNARLFALTLAEQTQVRHVDALKLRLTTLQQRLHAAKEAGDRTRAAALRAKIEGVKGRIAASNAKLERIARKKTQIVNKINVPVTTNVRIRDVLVARRRATTRNMRTIVMP